MAPRPPSTKARIGAAVAAFLLVAGILLSLVAPGSNGGTTTTVPSSLPTTSQGPPPTVSDEDFERIAAGIADLIAAAGTQRCPLVSAFTAFGELPDPADPAQVRTAVELTVQLLDATAASAGPDEAATAQAITAAADALELEGETEGYDPAWLNTPPGNKALAEPAFTAAFETYQRRTLELCPVSGADGTGPSTQDDNG